MNIQSCFLVCPNILLTFSCILQDGELFQQWQTNKTPLRGNQSQLHGYTQAALLAWGPVSLVHCQKQIVSDSMSSLYKGSTPTKVRVLLQKSPPAKRDCKLKLNIRLKVIHLKTKSEKPFKQCSPSLPTQIHHFHVINLFIF